ncbi:MULTISPECIES: ImmA/IrrE family metallo-endopeptidase [Anaerococcus]|uniref:ImmA/IrrE family metallo-endopeptidase n=1 Tax=Anaerococcus TaxID=165779 RepID=UPI001C10E823|nr:MULTISPECIES: ImmA/IrrE family metallo-endopeptidase [Anaerococcus]MDY3007321.1 ImmA/IrrE family metallo-endopeptidase [Anaerococcus porci]
MSDIGGYIAAPLSRKDLRRMAYELRKLFGFENKLDFPIVQVIEFLSNKGVFNLEICSIDEMGTKYGETVPSENLIKLREDIYEKACDNDGFSKSTCSHELLHWLIHGEETVSFCRREEDLMKRRVYEDPEWQANCFAGELLVPKHIVKGMSIDEIMEKCNVTYRMAQYQLSKYEEEGWGND